MSHHNCSHGKIKKNKFVKIIILCIVFIIIEIIGAYYSKSTAILNDSFHLISDLFGFSISYFGIWISSKKANYKYSSGFSMAETLGALFSIQITWIMIYFIINEAINRIFQKEYKNINIKDMLLVSFIGLIVNLIMIKILHEDKHNHINEEIIDKTVENYKSNNQIINEDITIENHCWHKTDCIESKPKHSCIKSNIIKISEKKIKIANHNHYDHNSKAAMIHIIGDLLQSVSVVIVSIILYFNPNVKILDPLLSILFSIIAFVLSINVFVDIINTILNKTPNHIKLENIIGFLESKNIKLSKCQILIDEKKRYDIILKLKSGELFDENFIELRSILNKENIKNIYVCK